MSVSIDVVKSQANYENEEDEGASVHQFSEHACLLVNRETQTHMAVRELASVVAACFAIQSRGYPVTKKECFFVEGYLDRIGPLCFGLTVTGDPRKRSLEKIL